MAVIRHRPQGMGMTRKGFRRFLGRAQGVLEELWGDEVEIGGVMYPAAVSAVAAGGTMGLGGDVPEGAIAVRVRKVHLAGKPEHGKTVVVYGGRRWRVDEVRGHGVDGAWFLRCIPADE